MFKEGINVTKLNQGEIIQVGDKRDTAKLVEEFYTENPFLIMTLLKEFFRFKKEIEGNEFTTNLKRLVGLGKRVIEDYK